MLYFFIMKTSVSEVLRIAAERYGSTNGREKEDFTYDA